MFITSQVFGVLALIAFFITFQAKKKVSLIIWNGIALFLIAVMFAFLLNWVVVAIVLISVIRNIVLFWYEKKGDAIPKWINFCTMFLFMIATAVAGGLTWYFWYDWILVTASVATIPAIWYNRLHLFRIALLVYAITLLIHNIITTNWMGIAIEVSSITSNIVFYTRLSIKKLRSLQSAKTPLE